MGLQCTIFSVQADSRVDSLWVYNVLFSLSRLTQLYTFIDLQCTILSVRADSSVYSLWVYNVLFYLSGLT